MKITSSENQGNKLGLIIDEIYKTTNCVKLWIYLDNKEANNDFIITDTSSLIFQISPTQRKNILKEIRRLENKQIISVRRDPKLKGILTLFINYPNKIYDY